MASTDRARLLVHEDPEGSLLLIHEVEQPSYLLLWEIVNLDFIYCALVASNPLQSSQVSAGAGTMIDAEASVTIVGTVTGGRC